MLLNSQPLPLKQSGRKMRAHAQARALRIAHIAREVRDGAYCVSSREIAEKYLRHALGRACGLS
jgi:anti-sigma28 factor (negative regulator of flagellin synthesis)